MKLLGVTISNDLKWNEHVDYVIKKVNKRIYFLIQLKRAKVPLKDLSLFFVTCIRSVMDYGNVSYFNSLPKYLKYEFVLNLHELKREPFQLYCPDMII